MTVPAVAREVLPGVVSTATALEIAEGMRFNEWQRLGERLVATSERAFWSIGDWRVYGDRFSAGYADALRKIDLKSQTVYRCAWVCRSVRADRRRSGLSFRHHLLVARLSEAEQEAWLNEAERHGWGTRELEERLAERRLTGARPAALSVRATGDLVSRFEARAAALGVPAKQLALAVLDLASQLDDPLGALEAAGASRALAA